MNYVEWKRKNEKWSERRYFIQPNDVEFPQQLKEIVENENYDLKLVTIDGFLVEDWQWLLKYDNDDWTDEYCRRLYNRDGIKIKW